MEFLPRSFASKIPKTEPCYSHPPPPSPFPLPHFSYLQMKASFRERVFLLRKFSMEENSNYTFAVLSTRDSGWDDYLRREIKRAHSKCR